MPASINKLLITADDFGLHPLINEAIVRCVEKGTVNSVSVMANADYSDFNVLKEFQKQNIFVGVHLSWVGCKWLTDNIKIADWKDFSIKLFTGGKNFRDKLKTEAIAQLTLFNENGILPDHIDSHQHVHHFKDVWLLTHELSLQFKINRIRCCKVANKALTKNGVTGFLFNKIASARFNPEKHFYAAGIKHAGKYSFEKITQEMSESSGVSTEFIFHPAMSTSALEKIYPEWQFDWKLEYDALMDNRLSSVITEYNFSLCKRSNKN